jgi:hypothetical protein
MRNSYQIIDDRGRVWHESSLALRAEYHGIVAGPSFVDYAIRNLGFIAMRRLGGDGVELRMRLECASEAALIAASYQLWDSAPTRIALTHWENGGWKFELHLGMVKFMARLARSTNAAKSNRQKRTLRVERSLNSLLERDNFRTIVLAWEAAKPRVTSAGFMAKLAALSGNCYTIFVKDPIAGFKVAGYGSNLPAFALKWLASGQSALSHHPDRDYAWACERSFTAVIERGAASLDEIDAIVQWRAPGSREGPFRRKYQRLLLPLLDSSCPGLISITRENLAIDLRA